MRTTDTDYGESYWESLDGGAGYRDSPIWEDLAHILTELQPAKRMLDVGCAAGYLVHHMRRRGVETFGLDFSTYALGLAPEIIKPFVGFTDLTRPHSMASMGIPFELVTCFETMEHIPEEHVQNAFGNLKIAMRPDAILVLSICLDTVPNWETDPTHITMKSRQWWKQQLDRADFQLHEMSALAFRQFRMFHNHDGIFVVSRNS
jgi:cyclopropane fatty-acyl-phospholipid synthase-like methyltransferase